MKYVALLSRLVALLFLGFYALPACCEETYPQQGVSGREIKTAERPKVASKRPDEGEGPSQVTLYDQAELFLCGNNLPRSVRSYPGGPGFAL